MVVQAVLPEGQAVDEPCAHGEKDQMKITDPSNKKKFKARLARLEGQLRGIQQMIDSERDCTDIVQQLSAISAGVHSASQAFLNIAVDDCLRQSSDKDPTLHDQIKELINLKS